MKKFTFLTLCSMFTAFSLIAQVSIFSYGSTWKYLDNGTNQGTVWRGTTFSDASWKTGNGKFGYGITDASTIVSFGTNNKNKYITTYFRKIVNIANPSAFAYYNAGIKRDDGVVVYVNGTEVYRNNLSTGTINYTTLASNASDNGTTEQTFRINSSSLVAGDNLIAVEIHQQNGNTPDMAFDMKLASPDLIPPTLLSINRQAPLISATNANYVIYRVTFSERVTGVNTTDFAVTTLSGVPSGFLAPYTVSNVGTDGTTYDVIVITYVSSSITVRLDLKSTGTGIADAAGNALIGGFTTGQSYSIDHTVPTVVGINRQSPASEVTLETAVTFRITFSESVNSLDVTDFSLVTTGSTTGILAANAVNAVGTDGTTYDVTASSVFGDGTLHLDLNSVGTGITDIAGNALVGGFTGGQTYTISQPLQLVSINRQSPLVENTSDGSVTYRVTFNKAVTGVDMGDFIAKPLSGNVRGTLCLLSNEPIGVVGTESVTPVGTTGSIYDVTVRALSGNGTMRLDLRDTGTYIMDAAGVFLGSGFNTGQTYNIQSTAGQGFASLTDINSFPISSHTAEKPQAKAWNYAGKWWTVMSTINGTKIFRMDGNTWTDVLTLGPSSNGKADCIVVGNVVHILVFRATFNSFIYSVEFDPATNAYKLWTQRPARATILFEAGAKTATLAMDGNNRLWVANDGVDAMYLRYSDAPYSTWSASSALVTGVLDDDICALVPLPGKMGIMWSNQNTQRFGFKTHINGDDPATWSADEAPGAQSALSLRMGMADDHISLVAAGDGTLYSAIKTGYETPGQLKVGLLVRHPNGTWDNPYPVAANEGTRPIVILNESAGKVKVLYTTLENGGDILYRESSTTNISFGRPYTLIGGNPVYIYNYATSTHQTFTSDVMILATDMTTGPDPIYAVSVLATDAAAAARTASTGLSSRSSLNVIQPQGRAELFARPNPFGSDAQVTFTMPVSGEYTLTLYNGMGVKVSLLRQGKAEKGQQQSFVIDGSRLSPGIYLVKLQSGTQTQTIKLIHK